MTVDKKATDPAPNYRALILPGLLLIACIFVSCSRGPHFIQTPYSDFIAMARTGRLARVLIAQDEIRFARKADVTSKVPAPDYADVTADNYRKIYRTVRLPGDGELC